MIKNELNEDIASDGERRLVDHKVILMYRGGVAELLVCYAEIEHTTGLFVEHIGEVLAAHSASFVRKDVFLPDDLHGALTKELGDPPVIDDGGIVLILNIFGSAARDLGNILNYALDLSDNELGVARLVGAQSALEGAMVADDIVSRAAVERADVEYDGVGCLDLLRDHELDLGIRLDCHHYRVNARVLTCRVSRLTVEFKMEAVARRVSRTGGKKYLARVAAYRYVKRDHNVDILHKTVINHKHRARGRKLLCRLEDKLYTAGKTVAHFGKTSAGIECHCGMRVVTAGVHLTFDLRFKRNIILFSDGERVHIRSYTDGKIRLFGIYRGNETALSIGFCVFDTHFIKFAS